MSYITTYAATFISSWEQENNLKNTRSLKKLNRSSKTFEERELKHTVTSSTPTSRLHWANYLYILWQHFVRSPKHQRMRQSGRRVKWKSKCKILKEKERKYARRMETERKREKEEQKLERKFRIFRKGLYEEKVEGSPTFNF